MSSIQINKTGIQVQMTITNKELTPLQEMLNCLRDVAGQLLSGWLKFVQEQTLSEWIGARWQPLSKTQRRLACPQCGSVDVQRKCWRTRTLDVDYFGTITLPRRQVCCSDCSRTWMPFEGKLKLPDGSHGPKLIAQALRRVVDMSYRKAAEHDPNGPSAGKLHRLVQKVVPADGPGQAQTAVVDGTEVPAWCSSDQISLSVAHQVAPAENKANESERPPRRKRRLLGVAAGAEVDIKPLLEPLDIQGLVHDGNMDLSASADHVGRCRWHVPYTVRYLLYQDGIKGDDNKTRVETLREHMWDTQQIEEWLTQNSDAHAACTHVKASLTALQEMDTCPKAFTVQTTSHVEREMKELNKRFENGGGWTPAGAENLLWLHQLNRHDPKRFTKTIQKLIKQTVSQN